MAQVNPAPVVYSDHPLLDGFAYSQIIEFDYQEDVNHRVVLGSLQRSRGEVVPENSERLRGNLTRMVYEISQDFSGEDVYAFYREQMMERGYRETFTCSGRACGSSNYWANDIFRNRILYGPERNQFYLSMQTSLGLETEPRISVYIITRGNRRLYAYVEVLEVGGLDVSDLLENTEALLVALRTNGSIVLPDIAFGDDDQLLAGSDVATVVDILQSDPSLNVYLVAHLQADAALPQLLERSRRRAQVLRQALIREGVDGGRVIAEGVGPLAPACVEGECENRLEMVLQ